MKRDVRIGLAVLLTMGLGATLLAARYIHRNQGQGGGDEPADASGVRADGNARTVAEAPSQQRQLTDFIRDHSAPAPHRQALTTMTVPAPGKRSIPSSAPTSKVPQRSSARGWAGPLRLVRRQPAPRPRNGVIGGAGCRLDRKSVV
jgi:hypothetical protein